jgi:hypothetical protein
MLKREMNIADYDAELWQAMEQEKVRQEEHIELIASENYTSPRVMQAQGSQLTNKYAEGYPGNATTAVASTLISLSNWLSIVQKSCSALTTLTSSRTLALRLTSRSTPRCCNRAIPFWV